MWKAAYLALSLGAYSIASIGPVLSAPAPPAADLRKLTAALADGPIQVRPVTLPPRSVTAGAAAKAARQAVGIPFDPARARPVTIVDRENLSRPVRDLRCWLVPGSRQIALLTENGTPGRETVYAAVDARMGLFIEAFTRPRAPWWHRISPTDQALLDSLRTSTRHVGVRAVPAHSRPGLSLRSALHLASCKKHPAEFEAGRGDQWIARFFVYTDFNTRVGNKLEVLRQPVWYISSEGLNLPFVGSVPAPAPGETREIRLPRTEELNQIINATSGQSYGTLEYRSGLRTDIMR